MSSRGAEQRIGNDSFASEARIRVRQYGCWIIGAALGDDKHTGARGKSGPVPVWVAKPVRNPNGVGRAIWDCYAALPQHFRANRLVGPVDISLGIRFLTDQAIHYARALRFLGVIHRPYQDAAVTFEIFEDRLGKNLVLADIHNDDIVAVSGGIPRDGRK